jgi:hypothetical protein
MTVRVGLIPDGPAEHDSVAAGHVPAPFFKTHFGFGLGAHRNAGDEAGCVRALSHETCIATQIADRCGTDPAATQKLLTALAESGYLHSLDGQFSMTGKARTWLVQDSPRSLSDAVMFGYYEWDLMCHTEEYVRTGAPIDFHEHMTGEQWALYQRATRALATQTAQEAALTIPVPDGATAMIDVDQFATLSELYFGVTSRSARGSRRLSPNGSAMRTCRSPGSRSRSTVARSPFRSRRSRP